MVYFSPYRFYLGSDLALCPPILCNIEKLVNATHATMNTAKQGVSQDLEIGCPNLIEISKQGVQIVHLQYIYI